MKRLILLLLIIHSISTYAAIDSKTFIKTTVKTAGEFRQLEDILVAQGFHRTQASKLLRSPLIPSKWHLNPQEKFLVLHNTAHQTEVRFYLDYSDEALVFWKNNGDYGIDKKEISFKVVEKTIQGQIKGSLNESIKKQANDEWVVNRFVDAFIWDHNLDKKLLRTDRFKLTVEEKYDEGQFVKYGEVLLAEITTKNETITRILYSKEGKKVYFDPTNSFEDRLFYAPVNYVHISSPFNPRRFHPIRHNIQPHMGIDFALSEGAPIFAPRDGVVKEISKKRGSGKFLVIEHDQNYFTVYNHLQSVAAALKEGQKVKAGEVLAYVGCSGYCTSPHLHFAIRKGKKMLNPAYLTKPYPFSAKNYRDSLEYKNLFAKK